MSEKLIIAPTAADRQDDKLESMLDELDSEKINLYCSEHPDYQGAPEKKKNGCAKCWTIYYIKELAGLPEEDRDEFLDRLESAVHHATELAEKGKFDVDIWDKPEIKIEKDAE